MVKFFVIIISELKRRLKKERLEVAKACMTGGGSFIDIRYRLTRPQQKNVSDIIYLKDQSTGSILRLANIPQIGLLKTQNDQKYRMGILLFRNEGQILRPGSRVTLCFGSFIIENIVIK